jgi:hypothetical protein
VSLRWEGGFYGYYFGNIAQTVEFYVEGVPAPATLLLLCIAAVARIGFRK